LKSARGVVVGVGLLALVGAGVWFARGRVQFDWVGLKAQMVGVQWGLVVLASAAIYVSSVLRGMRWKILLGGGGTMWRFVPSQFIGFTAVGLFGRVADLSRPYLIARRTHSAVARQLAVYSIERAFDLGAAAILFSVTLAFAPRSMPHHEAFARAGVLSLAATAFLAGFAIAVRLAGERLAEVLQRLLRPVSAKLADAAAVKTVEFSEGLKAMTTVGQMVSALVWSLGVWGLIALAYFWSARAFRLDPTLAGFSVPQTMLIMATSMGGSLLQLPVVGWFTQIGVLAVALHAFFGVPLEQASACGAVMMFVLTLAIVPGGLIAARIEGVGLRDAVKSGEAAAEVG
jgi:hypothetical protein